MSKMTGEQLHDLNVAAMLNVAGLSDEDRAIVEEALEAVHDPKPEDVQDAPVRRITAIVRVGSLDWAPGPAEYLWNVWEDGSVTMAWRREPGDAWGPTITAEVVS